jgi:hypothetical protein
VNADLRAYVDAAIAAGPERFGLIVVEAAFALHESDVDNPDNVEDRLSSLSPKFPFRTNRTASATIHESIASVCALNSRFVVNAYKHVLRSGLILKRPYILGRCLGFLLYADFPSGEEIAFLSAAHLSSFRAAEGGECVLETAEAIVLLAGLAGGGDAAFAIVERFGASGLRSSLMVEAATRIIASTQPRLLQRALFDLDVELSREDVDPLTVAPLIRDLQERAGASLLLRALLPLGVDARSTLFRAAFGTDSEASGLELTELWRPNGTFDIAFRGGSDVELTLSELMMGWLSDREEADLRRKLTALRYRKPQIRLDEDDGLEDTEELISRMMNRQAEAA